VPAERVERWLGGFAEWHGPITTTQAPSTVTLVAADGTRAVCQVPFPPLDAAPDESYGGLVRHVTRERSFGLVLVRRGGWAVGIAHGSTLAASAVGHRHVHGQTAAGGWSQQRYARRRDQQTAQLLDDAIDAVVRIVVPAAPELDVVVGGGDRLLIATLQADRRLAALAKLWDTRRLDVPDPRYDVLVAAVTQARAVRITVEDVHQARPSP
jgi:Actinobacteria/chloroflexi VLRF1 release factor